MSVITEKMIEDGYEAAKPSGIGDERTHRERFVDGLKASIAALDAKPVAWTQPSVLKLLAEDDDALGSIWNKRDMFEARGWIGDHEMPDDIPLFASPQPSTQLVEAAYDLSTWAACINWRGKENQPEWLTELREKIENVQKLCRPILAGSRKKDASE